MNTVTDQAQKAKDKWDEWMGSSCTKITAIVAAVIVAGVFTTATIYMGIYAYKNPDPVNCWVVRDVNQPALSKAAVIDLANKYGIEVTDGYPVELHKVYLAWFLWGFWAKLAFAGLIAVTFGVCFCSVQGGLILASISVGLYVINAIVWLACGGIWRFSKAGVIAAGDKLERVVGTTDEIWNAQVENAMVSSGYQINGGRFLKIYLMLSAWAIALLVIALIVMGIIMCCCAGNKEA